MCERERGVGRGRYIHRQAEGQTDRGMGQEERECVRERGERQTDKKETGRLMHRPTDRQIDRQTDIQIQREGRGVARLARVNAKGFSETSILWTLSVPLHAKCRIIQFLD